jgi:hypothetical protein
VETTDTRSVRSQYPEEVEREPIACQLNVDDVVGRADEWRSFVTSRVIEVNRDERSIRLRLEDSERAILVAMDLTRREKACCPFLDFRFVPLPEAIWLEIEAPEGAGAVLDALVDLTRS